MPETREGTPALFIGGLRDGQTHHLVWIGPTAVAPGLVEERGRATYDGERWVTTYPTEVYSMASREPLIYKYSHTIPAPVGNHSEGQSVA